jgi:hypothetical protein
LNKRKVMNAAGAHRIERGIHKGLVRTTMHNRPIAIAITRNKRLD